MCLTACCYLTSESYGTSHLTLQQDFKQAYAKWFNTSSGGNKQPPFAKDVSSKLLVTYDDLYYLILQKHRRINELVIYSCNTYRGLLTLLCNFILKTKK